MPRCSIEEQSITCVLYHPSKTFGQIVPGDSAAANDDPVVRQDFVELQGLL